MTGTPTRVLHARPSARSRGLALAVLCAATLMIILDGTIVTVALPSIQRELGMPQAGLTWVVNAYLVAFSGTLLLAGRLGDLLGRKRVFLVGLALFSAASLACGLAADPWSLIAARFAQGAGGASIAAVSLSMVTALYREPAEQARAIAAYSFVGAVGASLGLALGGVLTETLSWHWIFFVNLPIGGLAIAAAARLLPSDRGAARRGGADAIGALLATSGLMVGVYTITGVSDSGQPSSHTIGFAVLSLALLTAFVIRQARAAAPLLPLRVLAAGETGGANLAQVLVIGAAFGFQVVITLYMRHVLGYAPAATGLALLPTSVAIGAVSLGLSARLSARHGHRAVLLAGLMLIATALGLLTQAPVRGSYLAHLLPAMVIFGVGGGLTLPALASLAMSAADHADAGVASGLFNTTQQAGAALGVAVLSALAAARTDRLLASGAATAYAFASGYRLAFAAAACLVVAAILVAAVMLRGTPAGHAGDGGHGRPTRRRTARTADDPGEAEGARPTDPAPSAILKTG